MNNNKLLHKDNPQPKRQNIATTSTETSSQENILTSQHKENGVLLRMANVVLYGRDKFTIKTVALLDETPTVTSLHETLAKLG